MSTEQKLELLADILDLEIEKIDVDANLADYDEWDSVAILSFIAMMDDEFKKEVKGADIRAMKTVSDLLAIMEA